MPKEQKKKRLEGVANFFVLLGKIVGALFSVLILLFFVVFFLGLTSSVDILPSGNIAVIPVTGVISIGSDGSSLFGSAVADSNKIISRLQSANDSSRIKAIILDIDSPGGSPVATDEVVKMLKKIHKPKIAVIHEMGASGAYWIASATDRIFADSMSLTGSIGVIASHLEFAGLMQDYNVTYRRLVAGQYKDAGTPYKEMSKEEIALYQHILDEIRDFFVYDVATNRNLPVAVVQNLSNGFVYLGSDAQKLGLIDEIGQKPDAVAYLAKELNITPELAEFKAHAGLLDLFSSKFDYGAYLIGRGVGDSFAQASVQPSMKPSLS